MADDEELFKTHEGHEGLLWIYRRVNTDKDDRGNLIAGTRDGVLIHYKSSSGRVSTMFIEDHQLKVLNKLFTDKKGKYKPEGFGEYYE